MHAIYIPLYCGQEGPLRAMLVQQSIEEKDRFVEVVITDKEHLRRLGVGLKQHRTLARIVQIGPGQRLIAGGNYNVYVKRA